MISRLTALATCFAVLSAATITFAASLNAGRALPAQVVAAARLPVLQLPRVEITGHRTGDARR